MTKVISESKNFKIYQASVVYPNGKKSTIEYATLFNDTTDVVMVAPITQNDNAIFIEQYWPATQKSGLIFPGGKVDNEESNRDAAIRELAEETNLYAHEITEIISVEILPKHIKGTTHLYIAKNLEENTSFQGDEIDDIKLVYVPINEIPSLIKDGKITDSRTVCLSLLLKDYVS